MAATEWLRSTGGASGRPHIRRWRETACPRTGRIAAALIMLLSVPVSPARSAAQLTFSTYLGGGNGEQVRDVVTDAQGNVYAVGGTQSPNFVTTAGAYDRTHNGSTDVFVMKLTASGQLVWSTFVGGPNYDRAYAVELDPQGDVGIAGRAGAAFPTTSGVVQPSFAGDTNPNSAYGPQDGFIAELSADGSQLRWATYFGGPDRSLLRVTFVLGAGDQSSAALQGECGTLAFSAGPHEDPRCRMRMHSGRVARIRCS